MGIGKKLAEIIEQKNTNVNELANRTGITPSTIYSIIKRDNTKVDIQVLISLCEALNVKVDIFYQEYFKTQKIPPPENKWEVLEKYLETLSDNELIELEHFVEFLSWKKQQKSYQNGQE